MKASTQTLLIIRTRHHPSSKHYSWLVSCLHKNTFRNTQRKQGSRKLYTASDCTNKDLYFSVYCMFLPPPLQLWHAFENIHVNMIESVLHFSYTAIQEGSSSFNPERETQQIWIVPISVLKLISLLSTVLSLFVSSAHNSLTIIEQALKIQLSS